MVEDDPRAESLQPSSFEAADRLWNLGRYQAALDMYADRIAIAEQSGQTSQVIEGCMVAGLLALRFDLEPDAIGFWKKSLEFARGCPDPASLRFARLSAENLAKLFDERGLPRHAAEIRAKADAFGPPTAPKKGRVNDHSAGPIDRTQLLPSFSGSPDVLLRPGMEWTETLEPGELADLHWPNEPPDAKRSDHPDSHGSPAEEGESLDDATTKTLSRSRGVERREAGTPSNTGEQPEPVDGLTPQRIARLRALSLDYWEYRESPAETERASASHTRRPHRSGRK